ncbi:MAG: glycosyltransferase [Verrucomicrobiota bacterium]
MRFLFNTGVYKPAAVSSGPIHSVSGLAEKLVSRGHSVTVVASLIEGAYGAEVKSGTRRNIAGVDVIYFRTEPYIWQRLPIRRLKRLSVFTMEPAFLKWLNTLPTDYDIVDSQLGFLCSNGPLSKWAKKNRIGYFYHQRGNLDPIRFGANSLFKKIYIKLVEARILRRSNRLVALSRKEGDVFEKWAPGQPVSIVPNGVHVDDWRDQAVSSEITASIASRGDEPMILWFSRYNRLKGPFLFIDAVNQLRKRHSDFFAVMAGTDENGLREACIERIDELGLNDVIEVLPALGGEDRRYILQRAEIFALPTSGEGFSMAILEAMATRCAVVTTTEANFPELTENGAGEIVPLESEAFADAFERLLTKPAMRQSMVEQAERLVCDRYDWDMIATQYESIAETVVGELKSA